MLCMFVLCTHHFWFSRAHGRSDRVSPWRGWQCQLRLWPPSAGRWSYLFWSPLSLQYACLSFLPPLVIVFFSSLASFSSEILVFLIFFHIQLSNFSFNLTVPELFRITALLFIHLLMLPPSGAVVSPSNWFSSWSLSNSCCQLGSVSHWLLQICHFPNINLELTQIWSFSNESGIMWMLWKSKGDVQSETLFSSRGFMCDIIIAIVQANCQSSCYMYSQRTVGFAIPGSVGWL